MRSNVKILYFLFGKQSPGCDLDPAASDVVMTLKKGTKAINQFIESFGIPGFQSKGMINHMYKGKKSPTAKQLVANVKMIYKKWLEAGVFN